MRENDTGRPVGESRPAAELIRDISWGYRPAIVLLSAIRLRIFDAVAAGPATGPELAKRLGLNGRALAIVLDALVSLGLLAKSEGRFRVDPEIADLLVKGGELYQGNILDHRYNLLGRWTDLPRVLEEGGPARVMRSGRTPEEWREFILGMVDVAGASIDAFLEAVDLSGRSRLLDLGGGPATYSIGLCGKYPGLHAVLFDLPETIAIAREEIERHGLADRIETMPGDYLADPIGGGYDALLVSNILHSLPPGEIVSLLGKARSAMIPGGLAVVRDFHLEEERTGPLESALFAVNMLVSTEGGNCYTDSEMIEALRRAGFVDTETRRITPISSIHTGYVPG